MVRLNRIYIGRTNVVLRAKNITKKFGHFEALKGIDLHVEEGEVYGFIGPNGAGKSTTIRILLGMLRATSGKATIFGKDVWRDAVDIHKRVAYRSEDVSFWPKLTCGEVSDILLNVRSICELK